jgi:hypothetical protein
MNRQNRSLISNRVQIKEKYQIKGSNKFTVLVYAGFGEEL